MRRHHRCAWPNVRLTLPRNQPLVTRSSLLSLGLGKNTTAQLQAFRKRADDAKRMATQLKSQKTDVDFNHYRSILKNQDVVKQAEKIIADFKPVSYDVSAQLKAIDAFESKASEQAKATEQKIATELKDLKATLENIESARPFEQLTVDDVLAAKPEIRKTVEEMVKKGKWSTPGYEEKFGSEYGGRTGGQRRVAYIEADHCYSLSCALEQTSRSSKLEEDSDEGERGECRAWHIIMEYEHDLLDD